MALKSVQNRNHENVRTTITTIETSINKIKSMNCMTQTENPKRSTEPAFGGIFSEDESQLSGNVPLLAPHRKFLH